MNEDEYEDFVPDWVDYVLLTIGALIVVGAIAGIGWVILQILANLSEGG